MTEASFVPTLFKNNAEGFLIEAGQRLYPRMARMNTNLIGERLLLFLFVNIRVIRGQKGGSCVHPGYLSVTVIRGARLRRYREKNAALQELC